MKKRRGKKRRGKKRRGREGMMMIPGLRQAKSIRETFEVEKSVSACPTCRGQQ